MTTELIEAIKKYLIQDWVMVADWFIPQYADSARYIMKHPDEYYAYDVDKVIARERKTTMIRNCLHHSTLKRSFKDCTLAEIADDKLRRLIKLTEKRPELERIIAEGMGFDLAKNKMRNASN